MEEDASAPEPECTLFIKNIPYSATITDITLFLNNILRLRSRTHTLDGSCTKSERIPVVFQINPGTRRGQMIAKIRYDEASRSSREQGNDHNEMTHAVVFGTTKPE